MAQMPAAAPAPVTEEAFYADRKRFWSAFCNFTLYHAIALAILLALMGIFLV